MREKMAEEAKHSKKDQVKKDQVGTKLTKPAKEEQEKMEKEKLEQEKLDRQYDKLIHARDFHYENLNKWLTFFYVAVGAVFAGYCTLYDTMLGLIVLGVGYIISLAGYLSCKGYYYWEKNWIMLLHKFEKDNFQDQNRRVYSIFANVKGLDEPWNIIEGANVSTTKVALMLTFIITSVFGAILMYEFLYEFMPFEEECCNALLTAILSAILTWILARGGARALKSALDGLDDLNLKSQK